MSHPRGAGSPAERRRDRGFCRASAGRGLGSPNPISSRAFELFGLCRQQIIQELESILNEFGLDESSSLQPAIARAFAGDEVTLSWEHEHRSFECRIEIESSVQLIATIEVSAEPKPAPGLAARLLELQDQERRRLAHQLHNNTGQSLAALSMNLAMILRTAGLDRQVQEAIQESIALADGCVREVREMSYLLHPPLLDELGLPSALRAYAERAGIELELELPSQMPRLAQEIEIALFRIVEEVLAKGSTSAILRLKHEPDCVQLKVTCRSELDPVGMASVRERAGRLGGRLTIASGEGAITLEVVVPLQPQQFDAPVRST